MKLSGVLNFIMPLFYLVSGILLLSNKNFLQFSNYQRIGGGVLLIIYGIYRLHRSIIKLKDINDEKNNN